MGTTWYDDCYRKLFFDFHSPGTTVGLAAAFDAEGWADRLVAANAQAVSVFTKCGLGYSFYRQGSVRYPHPHLPEGLDMLGEQIEALHKRGLRAIGYYHTFNSEPVARDHPEWIELNADGTPRGNSICLLGPLAGEWMLPHIAEIVGLYELDGMFFDGTYAHGPCFCEACRKRFAADCSGLEIPSSSAEPAWARFVQWKMQAFVDLRKAICDVIHQHRPETIVSINWAYTPRVPEVVPEGIGALVADITPEDQVFNGSYLSAFWALQQRPFDVMNSAFLQWWGDWGCKPAVAMQQEVATAIAHGGLTWIGYQMQQDFDVQPAVMAQLGETLAFVRDREDLLKAAEPVPHVAVLHSTAGHMAGAEPAFFARETSARGAHRMLCQSMIPHHLVHEHTLLQRLAEFRAVIIPDQRYLSAELVTALGEWVRNGGVLICAGLAGTLDDSYRDTGRFALQDLLGMELVGRYEPSHAYIELTDDRLKPGVPDMPHLAEAPFVFARPISSDVEVLAGLRKVYLRSDGEYLLRWSPVGEDSGYPAITLRRVGEGFAATIAGDVFHAYQVKNQWTLKHIVANLLGATVADPPVTVEAPAWLEVVLMRQPARDRLLVHLVNHHGDHAVDTNYRCVEQVQPVRDVTVSALCARPPRAVTLEPGKVVPEWSYEQGKVTVQVPQVALHTAVAIEG